MNTWRQIKKFSRLLVFMLLLWWTGGGASVAQADPMVVGYYGNYDIYARNYTVDNLPLDKLTVVNYAFLGFENIGQPGTPPVYTGGLIFSDPNADTQFQYPEKEVSGKTLDAVKGNVNRLVQYRDNLYTNLKLLFAIGGANVDHTVFSGIAADDTKLAKFAQSCATFVSTNNFNGIDIDWEFPDGPNKNNFTKMLQAVRTALDNQGQIDNKTYYLSYASGVGPHLIPLTIDIPAVSEIVDWINLMTYDYAGGWTANKTTGQKITGLNAPLYEDPNFPIWDQDKNNAAWVVQQYIEGLAPANKLVLGLPLYGKSWVKVEGMNCGGLFQPGTFGPNPFRKDIPTDEQALLFSYGIYGEGAIDYWGVLKLIQEGTYTVYWDGYARVPYLYGPDVLKSADKMFVSYDNAASIAGKINLLRETGLGGAMYWEMSQDAKDPNDSLVSYVQKVINTPDKVLGVNAGNTDTFELPSGTLQTFNTVVGNAGTGIFDQIGGEHTPYYGVILGKKQGGSGTYTLSGGLLSSITTVVGSGGAGTFSQSGDSTHNVIDLIVAQEAGSSGEYTLSGGSLSSYNTFVGYSGTGTFTRTGGTHSAYDLLLGVNKDSVGTYYYSGGSLNVSHEMYIGIYGTGFMWPIGGGGNINSAISTWCLQLADEPGSTGEFILGGYDSLTTTFTVIGNGGSGLFEQRDNSTHTVMALTLGNETGSSGEYTLSGGSLISDSVWVGNHGDGKFTQEGGTVISECLYLPYPYPNSGASGAYNLNGGSLLAAIVFLTNDGAFTQTGGTFDFTTFRQLGGDATFTDLIVARTAGTSCSYTLSGGSLTADSILVNSGGTFTQTGGTLDAPLTLSGGTVTAGTNNGLGAQTLTINSGTIGANDAGVSLDNPLTIGGNFNMGGLQGTNLSLSQDLNLRTHTLTHNGLSSDTLAGNVTNGSINVTAGALTLSGAGANSAEVATNGGILNMSGGAATTFTGAAAVTAGVLNLTGGTLSGLLTMNGGSFNMSGNAQYTNGGPVTNPVGGTLNIGKGTTMNVGGGLTNNGATTVNGSLNWDLTNNAGGLVNGAGTITGALVNNGTVNPGNSPGTLTVGTYTSNPGSTQVVEIASATNYDRIVTTAAGGATLNGGTLSPRLLNGYLPSTNQVFPGIVEATGGGAVTGAFDGIDNTRVGASRTLFWQALYTNTTADLKAVGNYTPPDLSLSINQRSVGNALNSLAPSTNGGDLLTVLDAINALTSDSGVRAAYNEISPGKYAALGTMSMPITHLQFQYLQNRLARERWEAELGSEALSAGGGGFMRGFNFNYDSSSKMMLAASNMTVSDAGTRYINHGVQQRWGVYLEPMANWGTLNATANMVGYRYKNFGFTLGAEYWVMDNLLVGVNTGYSKTLGSAGGTGADLNANVIPFNVYGAYFLKGFYANAMVGYTYSGYDMERNIAFGTINRTAKASTSGNQFQLGAETGYDAKIGNAVVGPVLSLQYATQTVGGFTESNAGALSLKVGSQSANSVQSGVGVRASYKAKVGGVPVKPQVSVTWQHEFSDNTRGLNASLAAGGSTINFRTDRIGQDFALISLDVPAKITKNLVANVGYTAEVGRDKSTNMGINVGLKLKF